MNIPAPIRSKKGPVIATALITAAGLGLFGYQANWLDEISDRLFKQDASSILESRLDSVSQGLDEVSAQVDTLTRDLEQAQATLTRYERTLAKFTEALQNRKADGSFDFLGQPMTTEQAEQQATTWKISYDTAKNRVAYLTEALVDTRSIQGRFEKARAEIQAEIVKIESLEAENERREALNRSSETLASVLNVDGAADDDVIRKQVRELERRNRELETKSGTATGVAVNNSLDAVSARLAEEEAAAKRGNGLDWLNQNFGVKPAPSAAPAE